MARFSLTISDLAPEEAAAIIQGMTVGAPVGKVHGTIPVAPEATVAKRVPLDINTPPGVIPIKRGRGRPPKVMPANTGVPTEVPPVAVAAAVEAAPAESPVTVAHPSLVLPVPAAVAAEVTAASLLTKARALGSGRLKQSALLQVLNVMHVPSFPKLQAKDYATFDALLDAATDYVTKTTGTADDLRALCVEGTPTEVIANLRAAIK